MLNVISNIAFLVLWGTLISGFTSGQSDWLIIFYGCAPENRKAEFNGDRVHSIASNSMIFLELVTVLKLCIEFAWAARLWKPYFVCVIVTWIAMYILAYKLGIKQKSTEKNIKDNKTDIESK